MADEANEENDAYESDSDSNSEEEPRKKVRARGAMEHSSSESDDDVRVCSRDRASLDLSFECAGITQRY